MRLILGGQLCMADFEDAARSEPVTQVVQDPLEAGREALRRRDWIEGYELLQSGGRD